MERVHVLLGGDRLNYRVLVDVLRQRQLNEYAVYLRIAVQRGDKLKQRFLRDGIVKFIFVAHKAALLTVALLTGDVYARSGIVPDEHDRKPGFARERCRLARSFLAHPLRKRLAVYQHCRASKIMGRPAH